MKTLLIIAALAVLSGCGVIATTPYGQIETNTDSQIFTYTDADVSISGGDVKSDDTTVIIVGVKDNTGADLETIFVEAMTQIKEIFKARQEVYESWITGK